MPISASAPATVPGERAQGRCASGPISLPAPRPLGAPLGLPVPRLLGDPVLVETIADELASLAAQGLPACLSADGLDGSAEPIRDWQKCCELLADGLARRARSARGTATCMPAGVMPAAAYRLVTDAVLGRGDRYLALDDRHFGAASDGCWSELFEASRAGRPLQAVYGDAIRSDCPLLGAERADALTPTGGVRVPAGSAWLCVEVALADFADNRGVVDEDRLFDALTAAHQSAEDALDATAWPNRTLAADAAVNRRLAFVPRGFGDIALRRGNVPGDLRLLRDLGDLARRIRTHLYDRSRRLAACSAPLPALQVPRLACGGPGGEGGTVWNLAFEDALRRTAVRHRNLVVMSPWSVLPSNGPCDPAYRDLLPVIAHADAWAFAGGTLPAGWTAADLRHFHARARAIIESCHAKSFVAAGV